MHESLLDVDSVTLRFGGLTAVQEVSFTVRQGEILSVIGPNGAGKTSLFNAITGVYTPTSGEVRYRGHTTIRQPNAKAAAWWLFSALFSGVLLVLACNIQTLWEASITAHYVYQQPFPWSSALSSLFRTLDELPQSLSVLPFVIGLTVGGGGAYSVWRRARRTPDFVAEHGIARTFQNIRLFHSMSALENILVGMDQKLHTRLWHAAFSLPQARRETADAVGKAMELLEFVGLAEKANVRATSLPYGYQRRLEIARALASDPSILLLDEPAAGMNPSESGELMELIRKIRARGVTVLLIEHHMKVVMGISDRIVVLHYGNKIAEGTPEEVRLNPKVIEAYLGKEGDVH